MYFGLTNSPATFQAMMNNLFRDMINKGDVATFIDDVLVTTETEEGHNDIVEEVLRQLEEDNLYVKPEKCVWKAKEIGFLEVIMGPDGFKMEKEKVEGVTNYPTPQSVKNIQKFLGLANYYQQFVKDFAKIAKLLYQLACKDEKWHWGKEQEEVFAHLKEIFTMEPVLAAPDLDKEMRVKADALDYTTGGILLVKGEDRRWRPVAFISKLLNDIERNYKIHDKGILVVIWCLEA